MAESIGAVRIDIIGNAEDLKVEVARAKTMVASMGPEFEKSFAKMTQSQKTATLAALKFEQQIGKSKDEIRLMSLAARGAAPEALEKVRQKLLQTRDAAAVTNVALGAQSKAFAGSSKTARELQFAMRGLPAQLTDVFTSLASGQRPMLVLLQQGGQLKDMFGGIGPAARALGGAIAGLVNPLTLAAGAVGVLTLAWRQASNEADAFTRAIILTGNVAGVSNQDLEDMADRLESVTSASTGAAREAVAQAAATGRFTKEQIESVARAALEMREATGAAVEDTIAGFVRLADDPVRAIETLNKSQHLLDASTLKQVESLKAQGKEAEAAALAIQAVATATIERTDQVEASLSAWATIWHDIGSGAKTAFDAVARGITDADNAAASAKSLLAILTTLNPALGGAAGAYLASVQARTGQGQAAPGNTGFSGGPQFNIPGLGQPFSITTPRVPFSGASGSDFTPAAEIEETTQAIQRRNQATERALTLEEEWAILEAEVYGPAEIAAHNKKVTAWAAEEQAVLDTTSAMAVYADQAARNMQDAFADFLFDPFDKGLKGMLEGLADTLRRMMAEIAASKILQTLGVMGGGTLGGESAGTLFDLFSGSGFGFAKGGVFANSPSLSAYSGGVYDKPHMFKFARGAGIFGEAGPEAIMPLQRGKDGKLGVQANGGGVVVEINNFGGSPVSAREETMAGLDGATLRKIVIDIAAEDVAAGGKLARANKQRFGLREMV